jgi:hypothetical protein
MATAGTRSTAVVATQRPPLPTASELMQLADILFKGGMTSKTVNRPEAIATRIIAGWQLGIPIVQAVSTILIVNGVSKLWGDTPLALVRASGKLVSIEERIEGEGDDMEAVCVVHRSGDKSPKEFRFSVADAKTACLWAPVGKDGKPSESPWNRYPKVMLKFRARSTALRDVFTDVLNGIGIADDVIEVVDGSTVPIASTVATAAVETMVTATATTAKVPANDELEFGVETAALLPDIAEARSVWLEQQGLDAEVDAEKVKEVWSAKLSEYGVWSAKQLVPEEARQLLDELRESTAGKA